MAEGLLEVARALRAALSGFDPALLSADNCVAIVEELALTEKACASARTRAALRATQCGAHRQKGFADGVDWLARMAGSSSSAARSALEVVSGVDGCPATKDALVAGNLSLDQAGPSS